jgi:O-methyltransferase involved in polyketide biosynthesis
VAAEHGGLASFVSFTAMIVAAQRIAEGRHSKPILQDALLCDLLSSTPGAAPPLMPCMQLSWSRTPHALPA